MRSMRLEMIKGVRGAGVGEGEFVEVLGKTGEVPPSLFRFSLFFLFLSVFFRTLWIYV